jgi:hypothetical protein
MFMRRFVSYLGIFLLALLVSGSGSVLAAALCPHAGSSQSQAAAAEDHACCRAKLEKTEAPRRHSHSSHQEKAHCTKTSSASASHNHGGGGAVFKQATEACAHCIGRNELPATPASVRELTLQKRAASKMVGHTAVPAQPPTAISIAHFTPTQHAPPEPAIRKHLLLSVFLI